MSDPGPDSSPTDESTDEELAIVIDLEKITNVGGEDGSESDEGSTKSRHPTSRRLLP